MVDEVKKTRTDTYVILKKVTSGDISSGDALNLFVELDTQNLNTNFEVGKAVGLEVVMKELDDLIGLREIKGLIKEIQAFAKIQKRRREEKLQVESQALHMIFRGNPGTGKTTVARLLGKMFNHMGILQKGHTIEVERADLVGEYIGHTAQKTREQVRRAIGGILFIDEAYSLARGGEKDFGKEAIDTLVRSMEDHKEDLIVVLAGYKDEMDWFLRTNPGLRSRFPIIMEFHDYSTGELVEIAQLMAKKRDYNLSKPAINKLEEQLHILQGNPLYSKMGNARLVRNILEKAIRRQALRLVAQKNISRQDLMSVKAEDISEVERP